MVIAYTQGSIGTGVLDSYNASLVTQNSSKQRQIEKYNDPSKDYGFYIAVRIGDSNQENSFHPSHSILNKLKAEGYDLSRLPEDPRQAIHLDGFHFHKSKHHPVTEIHRADPLIATKNYLYNAIVEGMNKNLREKEYNYQIFDPVNLILQYQRGAPYSDHAIRLNFQDSNGNAVSVVKDFTDHQLYGFGDLDTPFTGWLERTVDMIIEKALK
jgi:hypothetical protein